jgi:hypothetical protein
MSNSFFNFSDLNNLQFEPFDQNLGYEAQHFSQVNSKDPNCISTEAPSEDAFNPSSRSKKTCVNPFESSF